jgi:N-methylhydantoinase B
MTINPITLGILRDTITSIPVEMGIVLRNTAFSPNIKERLDSSCALFEQSGKMLAQAEHIPVHLGTMNKAVEEVLDMDIGRGDQILMNDPFRSGTHLPDLTLVKPVFYNLKLVGYVANKAHHADVGGSTPGSMPGDSRDIWQEGIIIPPVKILEQGKEKSDIFEILLRNTRVPAERVGDLRAQIGANELGARRLEEFIEKNSFECYNEFSNEIIEYSSRITRKAIEKIPKGVFRAVDWMEERGENLLRIKAEISVDEKIKVDFLGTSPQSKSNLNAPLAVTRSAAYFVFRCLVKEDLPLNEGFYQNIDIRVPDGSMLNPSSNSAVAGGNVETSQRIVDVLFLALARAMPELIPAQSQGTMNNVTLGNEKFTYYETIGGGAGATSSKKGESGVQVNMTNTKNTPIEVIELTYPLRVVEYSIRKGSGGVGKYMGGEGIKREIKILEPCILSIISERRKISPRGLKGGERGKPGCNYLIRNGEKIPLPSKVAIEVKAGDRFVIETPGGGGWGKPKRITE